MHLMGKGHLQLVAGNFFQREELPRRENVPLTGWRFGAIWIALLVGSWALAIGIARLLMQTGDALLRWLS